MSDQKFIVAQLGARMHYAVPRILHEAECLERLYTDFSADQSWPKALNLIPRRFRPSAIQRLLGRVAKGVPAEKVTAFNTLGLRYTRRLRHSQSPKARSQAFLWAGKEFCRKVLEHGWGGANAVYTFNTAGLEILQAARRDGLKTISEQTIAPKQVEMELLQVERQVYPAWERDGGADPLAPLLAERELAEWQEAGVILCACEFVREGIARCGGPVNKCVVVPYGVDVPGQNAGSGNRKSQIKNRPLRVLTVGVVGLRKGAPYVLEAAKLLEGKALFRMVGIIGVTGEAEAKLREHVELTGPVPRASIAEQFAWADVFLLPSLCEGSATVTYEAMAHGLPVICTPNTGSVVRDGLEGFIVPARDSNAIVERIERLGQEGGLRERMAANAKAWAVGFTVAAYGQRLLAELTSAPRVASLNQP